MESVPAWSDCSPDLITSIGVTTAFPALWAASGRAACQLHVHSSHGLTIKEKVIYICITLTKEYMKYPFKELEGLEIPP